MFKNCSNFASSIVYCIDVHVYMHVYNVLLTNSCNMHEIKIFLLYMALLRTIWYGNNLFDITEIHNTLL